MSSTPPESGSNAPSKRTDFHSLMAPPEDGLAPAGDVAPVNTGLSQLQRGPVATVHVRHTITDRLIDFLTPFLILVMVYAVIFFLLDVRYIYTEVFDQNLRFVALAFIIGVVALNRLIARDGADESVLYMFALAAAIGMYTLVSTTWYEVESIGGSTMNRNLWTAAGFNMLVVALTWWVVNRLVHECCVDENFTAGDVGILRGAGQRFRARFRKQRPEEREAWEKAQRWGRDTALTDATGTQYDLKPFDPTEDHVQPKPTVPARKGPTAADKLGRRHPGLSIFVFSVPVMIIFSLGLPVVRNAGAGWVMKGQVYMGIYIFSALTLLMLTSLGGLRQYFRNRGVPMPERIGCFWVGLGLVMVVAVLTAALQIPRPPLPPMAYVEEHKVDPWQYDWFSFQMVKPESMSEESIETTRHMMDLVGQGVLVLFGLFLAYAGLRGLGVVAGRIARKRERYPRWVIRFFDFLDWLIETILRVPSLPRRRPRRRIQRAIATSRHFQNPLGAPEGQRMGVADQVQYAYDALCALAYDLGVPRRADETPYEYIDRFPPELKALQEEAQELTGLYVRAAYSPIQLDERVFDRLRRFWMTYNHVRRRHVR
ncbi:MAG: DUF4129 domain-containing protein [Candidatus Hydrogenedentota bacterium]